MKKIGIAAGQVLLSLTKQEFKKLTKLNHDDVSDNTEISSEWLGELIDTVDDNGNLLKKVKKDCENLALSIGNITDA